MQAAIFDMDGLMVDTEGIYWAVGRQMARENGREVSDETLGRMMGRAPLDSIELYAREVGLTRPPPQLMRERDDRVMEIIRAGIEPMPGLMEVLDSFRPRFKMAIATAPGELSSMSSLTGSKSTTISTFFKPLTTSPAASLIRRSTRWRWKNLASRLVNRLLWERFFQWRIGRQAVGGIYDRRAVGIHAEETELQFRALRGGKSFGRQ